VAKKRDYAACLKNEVKFLVASIYKNNFYSIFLHKFASANAGL
jgi:hypothetical protein